MARTSGYRDPFGQGAIKLSKSSVSSMAGGHNLNRGFVSVRNPFLDTEGNIWRREEEAQSVRGYSGFAGGSPGYESESGWVSSGLSARGFQAEAEEEEDAQQAWIPWAWGAGGLALGVVGVLAVNFFRNNNRGGKSEDHGYY